MKNIQGLDGKDLANGIPSEVYNDFPTEKTPAWWLSNAKSGDYDALSVPDLTKLLKSGGVSSKDIAGIVSLRNPPPNKDSKKSAFTYRG